MKNKKKKNETTFLETPVEDVNNARNFIIELLDGKQTTSNLTPQVQNILSIVLAIINSHIALVNMIHGGRATIRKLQQFIFGKKSEKSSKDTPPSNNVGSKPKDDKNDNGGNNSSGHNNDSTSSQGQNKPNNSDECGKSQNASSDTELEEKTKRKGGGGRNGHEAFTGATVIQCPLCETLKPGQICPACQKHKLFEMPPIISIRLIGSSAVVGLKFEQERSGCVCGAVYNGEAPSEYADIFAGPKFSASAISSIMHQKYGLGVPFGTTASYQENVGIPLPDSTQANKINDNMPVMKAVFGALEYSGANRDICGFDDTGITILEGREDKDGNKTLKGHGSVFVCKNKDADDVVTLFYLDFEHAGKSFLKLMALRDVDSPPVIKICDGLGCYKSPSDDKDNQVNSIDCSCNVHSRRNFFTFDPKGENYICTFIISKYKDVYKNEAFCRDQTMNAYDRQQYHFQNSKQAMDDIVDMCAFVVSQPLSPESEELRKKLNLPSHISPFPDNFDLHKYAKYILKRVVPLTNFLHIPGVPLDTNYVERVIKAIIEIRCRGLFFKTEISAKNAGMILSIIETATRNGVNSLLYIEFLIENEEEVMKAPENFLPWNYQSSKIYRIKRIVATPFAARPFGSLHPSTVSVTQ